MDSKYIKKLFGDNYDGFKYKEAENVIGIKYEQFRTNIQNTDGTFKISKEIDLEAIYTFTLFCYYNWFGYPIKIIIAPELCNFLRIYYRFAEIEEVVISGKPIDEYGEKRKALIHKGHERIVKNAYVMFNREKDVVLVDSLYELLRMPNNVIYILNRYLEGIDTNRTIVKSASEFHNNRTIQKLIATKLEKLFICIFKEYQNYLYDGNFEFSLQHRKDIMTILTAFGLTDYSKYADLIKNHKHLMNDDNIKPRHFYSQRKIYINSGEENDKILIELSKEKIIKEALKQLIIT